MGEGLLRSVEDMAYGDHGCLVCESDREQWGASSAYVRHGLSLGERVLYVTADRSELEVRRMLAIDRTSTGELVVLPASIAYGISGRRFDPVAQLDGWKDHVYTALNDGFSGFRAVVEMNWLEQVDMPLESLVDYERSGNGLFRGLPGSVLCVYDRRHFDDFTLARVGHAHPCRFGRLAEPASMLRTELLEIRSAGPGALALFGEVDASNLGVVIEALGSAADEDGRLLIDMAGLEFIDFAGLRAIHAFSQEGGRNGGKLVLLSPPAIARRMIELLGADGSLTLEDGPTARPAA